MHPTNDQLLDKLDEIEDLIRGHVADSLVWRQRVELELGQNTADTKVVRDAVTTARTLRRIITWVGGLAVGMTGLIGLWQVLNPRITP